jgi:hypothetical protein
MFNRIKKLAKWSSCAAATGAAIGTFADLITCAPAQCNYMIKNMDVFNCTDLVSNIYYKVRICGVTCNSTSNYDTLYSQSTAATDTCWVNSAYLIYGGTLVMAALYLPFGIAYLRNNDVPVAQPPQPIAENNLPAPPMRAAGIDEIEYSEGRPGLRTAYYDPKNPYRCVLFMTPPDSPESKIDVPAGIEMKAFKLQ